MSTTVESVRKFWASQSSYAAVAADKFPGTKVDIDCLLAEIDRQAAQLSEFAKRSNWRRRRVSPGEMPTWEYIGSSNPIADARLLDAAEHNGEEA